MPERHPAWVTGINDFEARLAAGAAITPHPFGDVSDPLQVRSGIRDAQGSPGRVALGTNTVTVNAFQAVIQDPARPGRGAYVVTLDAPKDLPLTAADPALSRIDLVVAEVDSTVDTGFVVRVVPGDSSTSPVAPTVTNPLHLKLAQVSVPAAGGVPATTDLRQFTAALGGIVPIRGAADLPPVDGPASQFIYRLDTGELQVRQSSESNSGWKPYRPPRLDTWHDAPLINGWTNHGYGYATAQYTKTDDGWVRFKGLIRYGDVTKTIFRLEEEDYRPLERHVFAQKIQGGVGRLDVLPDGEVTGASGEPVSTNWTSLSGVAFPTY